MSWIRIVNNVIPDAFPFALEPQLLRLIIHLLPLRITID